MASVHSRTMARTARRTPPSIDPDGGPTRAIGYVRVSTEEQAREGVSVDMQQTKIRAWCELNDCALADIYTDAGISGKRADNRPGLAQALASCTPGSVLIVYSLSRLARSTRDTLDIAER